MRVRLPEVGSTHPPRLERLRDNSLLRLVQQAVAFLVAVILITVVAIVLCHIPC